MTGPTLLADLVDTSQSVGEHAGRRTKITRLADFLRTLSADEIDIGVSYLAGVTQQGRTGIGYALIRDAQPTANVEDPELTLAEVDSTLDQIARASGRGSIADRTRHLFALSARGTTREQEFLAPLLLRALR